MTDAEVWLHCGHTRAHVELQAEHLADYLVENHASKRARHEEALDLASQIAGRNNPEYREELIRMVKSRIQGD